jgi:hypothetical protein
MKQIEKIQIWLNGESKTANVLNASIFFDDMESYCSFSYELISSEKSTEEEDVNLVQTLANGSVNLSGEDYLEWDGSNDYAYNYIANKLNLTIK